MRNAFASEITHLAKQDSRVVMLSGDIGNRLFDKFKATAGNRFFNCGVAEANMMGMAAGLALSGLRPVVYTITPFITTRCFEQIRVDVCYQNQPVVIVGVGSGLSYASLGATHHSCEDVAIMRSLPNMTVVCPGDPVEVRLAISAAIKHSGPVYIRIGKKGEEVIHKTPPAFTLGKGIVVREGTHACILATGCMLAEAMAASTLLADQGLSIHVVSLHTVKPLDAFLLQAVFDQFPLVVTAEEHSAIGGLGSAVAEWLIDHSSSRHATLCRLATPDRFLGHYGTQENAHTQLGLDADGIAKIIRRRLDR